MQPLKSCSPILVAESGMDTFVNELQPWKAHSPMSVTEIWDENVCQRAATLKGESGIVTLANERQH